MSFEIANPETYQPQPEDAEVFARIIQRQGALQSIETYGGDSTTVIRTDRGQLRFFPVLPYQLADHVKAGGHRPEFKGDSKHIVPAAPGAEVSGLEFVDKGFNDAGKRLFDIVVKTTRGDLIIPIQSNKKHVLGAWVLADGEVNDSEYEDDEVLEKVREEVLRERGEF